MSRSRPGTSGAPAPRRRSTSTPPARRSGGDGGRWRVIRDLAVFELKLLIDGFKDAVLVPFAAVAAAWDLALGDTSGRGMFYRLVGLGERFDLWLNLYRPVRDDELDPESVLDRGGSDVLVERLEEVARRAGYELKRRRDPGDGGTGAQGR